MSQATTQPDATPTHEEDDYAPAPRTRWQRWKRRLIVIAVVLVLVAIAGEVVISRVIQSQLEKLVDRKLDARLHIGSVLYIPPRTAWAWNVRLVRNSNELLRLNKIAVSLGDLPIRGSDAPLVISSLAIDRPQLNCLPGGFDNIGKPQAKQAFPRKLSEMLRLDRIRLADGRIAYYSGVPNEPATTWENLSLDADLSQQSPSRYTFRIRSTAAPLADAGLSGAIDVDELVLQLESMTLNAEAQPEPKRTPLPGAVQKFITDNRITGDLVINGTGTVPLREPKKASCLLTIALKDGTALVPHENVLLEHARASIVCQKTPDGPVQIRLDTIDIAGTGRQVLIDGGLLELYYDAGTSRPQTFKLTDLAGHIQLLPAPATSPSDARMARTTGPAKLLDEVRPAGRIDFTATASGPLKVEGPRPWEAIRHEIIAYPRNLSFQLKDFAHRFEKIEGGEARLVNGTMIFQELRGRYGDDDIRVRGARLPLQGLPQIQTWREISAAVIFNPPLTKYSPPLDRVLSLANPSGAFLIAGNYTFDKSNPSEKPRIDYDMILSSDTGAVTVTSKQLTFTKIRGDATLTPAGTEIHGVEAELLGGKVRASGNFKTADANQPDVYAGQITIVDLDLPQLETQLGDPQQPGPDGKPKKPTLAGKAFVDGTFTGSVIPGDSDGSANLKSLAANGQYEVIGGNLYTLPVLRHVTQQIRGLKDAATLGDAAATFEITGGDLKLTNVAVNSTVLGLQGSGTVSLLDGKISGDVVAAPLADWKEKLNQMRIPLIGDIAGGIQKMLNTATGSLLYAFRITGTLKDVKVAAVPAPVLTDTAANVFGHMIKPLKDERPLDWIKSKLPRTPAKDEPQQK